MPGTNIYSQFFLDMCCLVCIISSITVKVQWKVTTNIYKSAQTTTSFVFHDKVVRSSTQHKKRDKPILIGKRRANTPQDFFVPFLVLHSALYYFYQPYMDKPNLIVSYIDPEVISQGDSGISFLETAPIFYNIEKM